MKDDWHDFEPRIRRMTPDDVLACFVDEHRQQCQYNAAMDSAARLNFDTTVADWREACDLLPCNTLGPALNKQFEINVSKDQWRAVLLPEFRSSLRGVCELIAAHAYAPVIEPARVFGRECRAAGAFLTLRWLLVTAGADVRDFRPSTPLDPLLRRHSSAVLQWASKVAPGRLPPVRIETPVYTFFAVVLAISTLAILVLEILKSFGVAWVPCGLVLSVPCVLISFIGTVIAAECSRRRVRFGSLQTVRDLCCALVGDREAT